MTDPADIPAKVMAFIDDGFLEVEMKRHNIRSLR